MEPATIGAIIGAAGSIIGNIILVRSRSKERRKNQNLLQGTTQTLETVKKGYGYGAKYVKCKAKIEDLEGKTRITREYYGVGVTRDGIKLSAFPHEVWVGAPGKIIAKPKRLPEIEKPGFRKHIGLTPEHYDCQSCKFRIEVEGGLTQTDGEINYGFEWTCSKAACMTREEAAEVYKDDLFKKEYFAFDVRYPTDELEIEIEFPEGYNVGTYSGVFLGGSEIWHDLELQRTKEGIRQISRGACLKINDPGLGYRYLIFWEPLSRREFEQLKAG